MIQSPTSLVMQDNCWTINSFGESGLKFNCGHWRKTEPMMDYLQIIIIKKKMQNSQKKANNWYIRYVKQNEALI